MKIAVTEKWPLPKSLKEMQSFLGLANYFGQFVDHFISVVAPLTALTGAIENGRARKPIQAVDWNNLSEEQVTAFQEFKKTLGYGTSFSHSRSEQTFSSAHRRFCGWHLCKKVALFLYTISKLAPAEFNYGTPEQELLGLVRALQVWRCYMEGAPDCELITDHHPLIQLQTQPNLSRRQARWMEFLSRFPFVIKCAKGSTNVADPVSRNPLLYDPATPNTVICVGTLGVVLSVMTRGQKRSKELRHDADLSHQHLPPLPLVREREDLVDSP